MINQFVLANVLHRPLRALVSVMAMGILTAFYTTMGGIKGVIWTDAIQVVTVLVGFTTVALSVLLNIPGGLAEVLRTGLAFGEI